MSGAGRVERASSNDLADLVCDVTGTSMQVAAVLVLQLRSPLDVAVVRQAIAARIATVPRVGAPHAATSGRCSRPSPRRSPRGCLATGRCGLPPWSPGSPRGAARWWWCSTTSSPTGSADWLFSPIHDVAAALQQELQVVTGAENAGRPEP